MLRRKLVFGKLTFPFVCSSNLFCKNWLFKSNRASLNLLDDHDSISGHLSVSVRERGTYISIATLDGTYHIYNLTERSLIATVPQRVGSLNVPIGSSYLGNGSFIACGNTYDISIWDYQKYARAQGKREAEGKKK